MFSLLQMFLEIQTTRSLFFATKKYLEEFKSQTFKYQTFNYSEEINPR